MHFIGMLLTNSLCFCISNHLFTKQRLYSSYINNEFDKMKALLQLQEWDDFWDAACFMCGAYLFIVSYQLRI